MVVHKYVCMSLVKPDMPIMHKGTGSTHTDNRKILLRCEETNATPAIEKYTHIQKYHIHCLDKKKPSLCLSRLESSTCTCKKIFSSLQSGRSGKEEKMTSGKIFFKNEETDRSSGSQLVSCAV